MSLLVFSDVTGLEPSPKFACRVRESGTAAWSDAFVFSSVSYTRDTLDSGYNNGYFEYLVNWTANWVSFEVAESASVEIEVEKLHDDGTISLAIPRPAHRAATSIAGGKAYVTLTGPQQVNIDIDGALEQHNAGIASLYAENRGEVHTISIFANPMLLDRPDPTDADVRTVAPGDPVPGVGEFNESTLYFLPGVHNLTHIPDCCVTQVIADGCVCIGYGSGTEAGFVAPYLLQSGKRYYVPGDAWLNGWMRSQGDWNTDSGYGISHMHILGYGHLSGSMMHWKNSDQDACRGVHMTGMENVSIVGLTVVDHPNHHLILHGKSESTASELWNTIHHVKVLGWRTNGDGIHVWGHWNNITDLFFRTQDDSAYIGDSSSFTTWTRIVTWNDANGVPFKFGSGNAGPTLLEDSDVIYHRKQFPYWCGAIFDLRWTNSRLNTIQHYEIKDLRITDPFPTCPLFDVMGSLRNVHFENVIMDRHSTYTTLPAWYCTESYSNQPDYRFGLSNDPFGCDLPYGIPNRITGGEGASEAQLDITNPLFNISNIHFTNVKVNGTSIFDLIYDPQYNGSFAVEGQVYDLVFDQAPPSLPPSVSPRPPPPSSPSSPAPPPDGPSPAPPPDAPSSGGGGSATAAIVGGVVGGVVAVLAIAAAVYVIKFKAKPKVHPEGRK
tara:strand:+ start:118 stop:2112 length:1995 start_codon:yes stop_codon:yes gene_type:complete